MVTTGACMDLLEYLLAFFHEDELLEQLPLGIFMVQLPFN